MLCVGLTVAVGGRILVRDLTLQLNAGDFVCMLGPNGVGKTLTLHTLAGLRPPDEGSIQLMGQPITELDRPTIAQRLGLLLQEQGDAFPTTVLETALMGCHSRLKLWQWETNDDIQVARDALNAMDLLDLQYRMSATLSGGERRRLAMATLLVQNPDVLLLDEPTNYLDPLHRLTVLTKLEGLTQQGRTVFASLHDPALAARFSDSVVLMYGDGNYQLGPTSEILTPKNLERLYGTPFANYSHDSHSVLLPMSYSDIERQESTQLDTH